MRWLPWCLGHELPVCGSPDANDNSTSGESQNSTDDSTHGSDFNSTSVEANKLSSNSTNTTSNNTSPAPNREPELIIPTNVTLRNLMRSCGRQGASMCPSSLPYMVDGLFSESYDAPSWSGDLVALSGVASVSIYPSGPNSLIKGTGSNKLLSIYVGNSRNATENQPCVENMTITAPWTIDVTCRKPLAGRFVHLVASGSDTVLSMIEVQVSGWYIEPTPSMGSNNCSKGYGYNRGSGICERCPIGWTTDDNVSSFEAKQPTSPDSLPCAHQAFPNTIWLCICNFVHNLVWQQLCAVHDRGRDHAHIVH
jgi:hypothetical protein